MALLPWGMPRGMPAPPYMRDVLPIGPCCAHRAEVRPSGRSVPRRAELCPAGPRCAHRAELCPVGPSCAPSGRVCPSGRVVLEAFGPRDAGGSVRVYGMMRLCVEMRMPITIVSPMVPITMVPITKV